MTEVIPFPGFRRSTPVSGQRVMKAGVDAALVAARGIPSSLVPMDSEICVRYFPSWELEVRAEGADLWITHRAASAPDRRLLLETLAGDLLEQDDVGRIWLNAEPLDAGALVEIGSASDERTGLLHLGDASAFLLALRDPASFRFSVHVTPPVLWIFDQPRAITREPVLQGWMHAAHLLWREQSCA